MARIPSTWDSGPDAEENAGDRGEARQAVKRGDEEWDRSGSWRDRIPYTSAEYHRLDGGRYDEW